MRCCFLFLIGFAWFPVSVLRVCVGFSGLFSFKVNLIIVLGVSMSEWSFNDKGLIP